MILTFLVSSYYADSSPKTLDEKLKQLYNKIKEKESKQSDVTNLLEYQKRNIN